MSHALATVRERLASGPKRGLGCANQIAAEAATLPATLKQLVEAASDSRALVSARAANALKKVQEASPALLAPYAGKIIRCALGCEELRTRWNLTLVVGELELKGRDRQLATELMFEALGSDSGFLRTFAMTGLVNLAQEDEKLKPRVREVVQRALEDASAAMRARARRLIPRV
jgi:hypothetical protein